MKRTPATLSRIIQASSLFPIRDCHYPTDEMNGRTHYYDADTLRAFRCKVIKARVFDGVTLVTICRQDVTYDHKKGYVIVAHDLTGTCIERTDMEQAYSTLRAAEKAFWKVCDSLDSRAVLHAAITRTKREAERATRDSAAALRLMGRTTTASSPVQAVVP